MENSAVYSRIDDLMAKADEIKLAVDAIQLDVDVFGEMLEDIQAFTNETNVVVKDILNGRQLSEWIDDLKSFGSNSTTYRDATRMNTLITNYDACSNMAIDNHLFNWALANNKLGTFIGTALNNTSVSWSNLTTPNSIAANSSAFAAMGRDSRVFGLYFENSTCKQCIWDNRSTVKSGLRTAENYLLTKAKTGWTGNTYSNKKWYVINIVTESDTGGSTGYWYYTIYDTKTEESLMLTGSSRTFPIREFISRCEESDYSYARGDIHYIEFA